MKGKIDELIEERNQYPIEYLFRNNELYGIYRVRTYIKGSEIILKYIGDIECEIIGLITFSGIKYIENKNDIILSYEEADTLYPEYFI